MPEPPKLSISQANAATIAALALSALMLLAAGARHPYFYYQMLRWLVTVSFLLAAWRFLNHRSAYMVLVCAPFVILFNPVSPIYMRRWQWTPYDQGTAVVCVALAIVLAWRTQTSAK